MKHKFFRFDGEDFVVYDLKRGEKAPFDGLHFYYTSIARWNVSDEMAFKFELENLREKRRLNCIYKGEIADSNVCLVAYKSAYDDAFPAFNEYGEVAP